jgi:hypothetical protein
MIGPVAYIGQISLRQMYNSLYDLPYEPLSFNFNEKRAVYKK